MKKGRFRLNISKKFKILMVSGLILLNGTVGSLDTIASTQSYASIERFTDIQSSFWGYNTVKWGIENNIISGYPDDTVKPNAYIKESEFITLLVRFYNASSIFEKSNNHWAEPFYKLAKDYHWIDNLIISDKPITRGRVAQLLAYSQGQNYDIDNSVQCILNNGISYGRYDQTIEGFVKDGYLTRVEAVAFLKNLNDKGLTNAKLRPQSPTPTLVKAKPSLFIIESNWKQGLIDKYGKIIVPIKYTGISAPFGDYPILVKISENQYTFINKEGKVVTKQYKGAGDFHEGLAAVQIFNTKETPEHDDRIGYINKNGDVVIPPKFYNASYFSEGLASVYTKGKNGLVSWGFIDKTGKIVIDAQFESAGAFHSGMALVSKWDSEKNQNLLGYINKTGKLVVPYQYTYANDFSEGLAAVNVDGKWGFIDTTGKVIISPQFASASDFSEGFASVAIQSKEGWKYGYIDYEGNWIIEPMYDEAHYFSEGLASVRLENTWKYINKANTTKLTTSYKINLAQPFINGLARIKVSNGNVYSWVYIKKDGQIVWQDNPDFQTTIK